MKIRILKKNYNIFLHQFKILMNTINDVTTDIVMTHNLRIFIL